MCAPPRLAARRRQTRTHVKSSGAQRVAAWRRLLAPTASAVLDERHVRATCSARRARQSAAAAAVRLWLRRLHARAALSVRRALTCPACVCARAGEEEECATASANAWRVRARQAASGASRLLRLLNFAAAAAAAARRLFKGAWPPCRLAAFTRLSALRPVWLPARAMASSFRKIAVGDLLNPTSGSGVPDAAAAVAAAAAAGVARSRVAPPHPFLVPMLNKYSCRTATCAAQFDSMAALHNHERKAHRKPTMHQCNLCHATFSNNANKNKHIRAVHEGRKKAKCEQCKLHFPYNDGLQRHIRMVHQQRRPYACTYCQHQFKTKSHLTKHCMTIHKHLYREVPVSAHAPRSSSLRKT